MSKITEEVVKKIEPVVNALGYDLLDVEYGRKFNGDNLTVTIDVARGVSIGDCERVHKEIDGVLDELDAERGLFPGGYTLNVSSPGVLRPLKNPKDFKRNLGKEIEVRLYRAGADGKTAFRGILTDYTEKDFSVDADGEKRTAAIKDAAKITPVVEF